MTTTIRLQVKNTFLETPDTHCAMDGMKRSKSEGSLSIDSDSPLRRTVEIFVQPFVAKSLEQEVPKTATEPDAASDVPEHGETSRPARARPGKRRRDRIKRLVNKMEQSEPWRHAVQQQAAEAPYSRTVNYLTKIIKGYD
eukprot:TRINITY_DN122977_c0_g1_i1.p1 TRINITY_DN122977_c0_g1~~TRINITY_DN122977_c0_g1_i1.p1  ORF type:complete len:140 (-),score=24.23 TRINITY_DN122977_c0_g1_i1:172-591(-)